jgi:hypothetical protein
MKPTLLPALVFAFVGGSCCTSDDLIEFTRSPVSSIGDGAYRYGATTDGVMIWWEVRFSDVANTPDWFPGEEPPLPISKAIELAERDVTKYTPMPGAYRLETVEWMPIGNPTGDARKWIYLVTFERDYNYHGRRFEARGTLRIPVLLDGRVIQGTKENDPVAER